MGKERGNAKAEDMDLGLTDSNEVEEGQRFGIRILEREGGGKYA